MAESEVNTDILSWPPTTKIVVKIDGNIERLCQVRYRPNIFRKIFQKVFSVIVIKIGVINVLIKVYYS